LRQASAQERVLMARDSYTYLHLPMVTGIVVSAIGVKRTLSALDAHLALVPATALCGGIALYLLALSIFKRRNVGSFNYQRLFVAAVLVALIPAATSVPALAALGLVTAAACGLITFEALRYAEARDRIRHGSS
jgi:low temperature requirement protein LtrA